MTAMCKFKVKDTVRVIDSHDVSHFDLVGTITGIDLDFHHCYEITLPSGRTLFFAATQLTLAPGGHE